MVTKRVRGVTQYPRPHDYDINFGFGLETGVVNRATCIPLAMYDEGLGSVSSYKANPKHASFAEASEPNCYPGSRVNKINVRLNMGLSHAGINTDNLHAVRYCVIPIYTAFKENLEAEDEISTLDIGEITELQKEATDKQVFPLWNGVDMVTGVSSDLLLPTNVPGLTTDQKIEGIALDMNNIYDCLQYYTNGGKLRHTIGKITWNTITRKSPLHTLKFKTSPKVKRMNPYTFAGLIIYVPESGNLNQTTGTGDTTNITHVIATCKIRFNEWHEKFNMDEA